MSNSRVKAALAFLPFGYQAVTRIHGLRDLAYLVASGWLPALWIAGRTGELSWPLTLAGFALGYAAFISLYELGYLANDAWDAGRHEHGRDRLPFAPTALSILMFVAVRLAVWVGVAVTTGWLTNAAWLGGCLALLLGMALHNVLNAPSLRLASFAQLAVLRFVMPIAALLSPDGWVVATLCALFLYLPLRLLAYADSKGVLALPDRRSRWFAPTYLAIGMPLVALLAFVLGQDVLVEVAVLLLAAHTAWATLAVQAKGAKR